MSRAPIIREMGTRYRLVPSLSVSSPPSITAAPPDKAFICSPLFVIESRQTEAVNVERCTAGAQEVGSNASDRGAKLEPVAREARHHQHALKLRMPVDYEVVVGRVVVDAHSGLANTRIGKRGYEV